jgi:hypothetical protein
MCLQARPPAHAVAHLPGSHLLNAIRNALWPLTTMALTLADLTRYDSRDLAFHPESPQPAPHRTSPPRPCLAHHFDAASTARTEPSTRTLFNGTCCVYCRQFHFDATSVHQLRLQHVRKGSTCSHSLLVISVALVEVGDLRNASFSQGADIGGIEFLVVSVTCD